MAAIRGCLRRILVCNASAGQAPTVMAGRKRGGVARILVTGAAGFIGSALCRGLAERGHRPVAGLRHPAPPPSTAEGLLLGDITPDRDWSRALRGVGIDI